MLFADMPEWVQQVLRELSREGYVYIGRTGAGLAHDFRRGVAVVMLPKNPSSYPGPAAPWKTCMKLGTIRAIEKTAQYHDLAYKLLLEQIAVLGPKWVPYEKIQELMQESPVLRALREEP